MSKIVISEFMTLDGVIEAPNQWSFQFGSDQQNQFKFSELFASDALLLGRVTYQGFAAAWPTMQGVGEYGVRMNTFPKYVVSTTLKQADWENSTIIKDNVADQIARLKKQHTQDILVFGSGKLSQTLMQHNLVDEYRLMVFPIVVGSGQRLFTDGSAKKSLKLVKSETFDSGAVVLSYEPASQ